MRKAGLVHLVRLCSTVAALCASVVVGPVLADPGLGVNNAIIKGEVEPGRTYIHPMVVRNEGDEPLDILVEACGFGQTLEGSYLAVPPEDDASPFSGLGFITGIDEPSFVLPPGGSKDVQVFFQIPEDAGEGTRYADILVHVPESGEGLSVKPAIDIPVALTVSPEHTLVLKGHIVDLSVAEAVEGRPILVRTTLQNTGNHHYKAFSQVTLKTGDGQVIERVSLPLTTTSIVPPFERRLDARMQSDAGLRTGTYVVESSVYSENGNLLDSKTATFDVVPYTAVRQLPHVPWFVVGGGMLLVLLFGLLLLALARRRRRGRMQHDTSGAA